MDSNKMGNNGLASFGAKYWQLWGRMDGHPLGNIGLALFGKKWTGTWWGRMDWHQLQHNRLARPVKGLNS